MIWYTWAKPHMIWSETIDHRFPCHLSQSRQPPSLRIWSHLSHLNHAYHLSKIYRSENYPKLNKLYTQFILVNHWFYNKRIAFERRLTCYIITELYIHIQTNKNRPVCTMLKRTKWNRNIRIELYLAHK